MQLLSCPSDAMLARHVMHPDTDPGLAAHVASCVRCRSALAELREVTTILGTASARASSGGLCFDEMAVARVAEGAGGPADLAHLAECAACRLQVAEVAAVIGVDDFEPRQGISRRTWPRRLAVVGAVAAAAVLTTVVTRTPANPPAGEAVYRDPAIVARAVPVVVSPVEAVAARPIRLRWSAAEGATEYRVTVFDEEGSVVWAGVANDTTTVIPAEAPLVEGVQYWWRVEARVGFDRWSQSVVTPFTIGRAAAEPGSASSTGR